MGRGRGKKHSQVKQYLISLSYSLIKHIYHNINLTIDLLCQIAKPSISSSSSKYSRVSTPADTFDDCHEGSTPSYNHVTFSPNQSYASSDDIIIVEPEQQNLEPAESNMIGQCLVEESTATAEEESVIDNVDNFYGFSDFSDIDAEMLKVGWVGLFIHKL